MQKTFKELILSQGMQRQAESPSAGLVSQIPNMTVAGTDHSQERGPPPGTLIQHSIFHGVPWEEAGITNQDRG